jgi:hypothetical protein
MPRLQKMTWSLSYSWTHIFLFYFLLISLFLRIQHQFLAICESWHIMQVVRLWDLWNFAEIEQVCDGIIPRIQTKSWRMNRVLIRLHHFDCPRELGSHICNCWQMPTFYTLSESEPLPRVHKVASSSSIKFKPLKFCHARDPQAVIDDDSIVFVYSAAYGFLPSRTSK